MPTPPPPPPPELDNIPLRRASASVSLSLSASPSPSRPSPASAPYSVRSSALSHPRTGSSSFAAYLPTDRNPHSSPAATASATASEDDEDDERQADLCGDRSTRASRASWWPLTLFQRHARPRTGRPPPLPLSYQSAPLLGSADDKKPVSYVRAAWGRVGRLSGRRRLSLLSSPRQRRNIVVGLMTIFLLVLVGLGINSRLVRPPPYNVVPRQEYAAVLNGFVREHNLTAYIASPEADGSSGWTDAIAEQLATLQDRLYARSLEARCAGTQQTSLVSFPVPSNQPPSVIPSVMYSSDRQALPANESELWRKSWADKGFDPVTFLDEDAAEAFVNHDFGEGPVKPVAALVATSKAQTAIQKAWHALPRGVLRADFMRYLLLLSRGGTWADMDVEPIGNLSDWTKPEERWASVPRGGTTKPSSADPKCAPYYTAPAGSGRDKLHLPPPEPVRLVVGLECEPWQYMQHSTRAWFEQARILAMPRHRETQFTQWTLHGAPGHPVLLDVVRRLLATDRAFDEYVARHQPFRRDATHPWTNIDAARQWILSDSTPSYHGSNEDESQNSSPTSRFWPWQWAWPRWGWHPLSVEEWTGPALWTDAVFTYLNAVAGLHPRDLYGLSQPIQVADVLVAPNAWFAPPRDDLAQAKVLHNFRGSWKHGADIVIPDPARAAQ